LLSLVLIEGGLRLVGLEMRTVQRARNAAALRSEDAIRVLCTGESTTALGGDQSYPAQLQQVLQERRPDREFRVINTGVGGADTALLLSLMPRNLETYRPHVVVAMMGFNDNVGLGSSGFPRWDQTLPDADTALTDREGLRHRLKTYRLAELLWFAVVSRHDRVPEIAEGTPPEVLAGLPPASMGAPPGHAEENAGPHRYYADHGRPAVLQQAQHRARSGDPEGAAALFREAARDEELAVRALVEWGETEEAAGELEAAEALFVEASAHDPEAGFPSFGRGRVALRRGDCDDAMAHFERAAARDPRCGHGLVGAALCFEIQEDEVRAHGALEDALKYKRALPTVLDEAEGAAYAQLYRVEGRGGEVWDQLARFEGGNPQDELGYIARIDLLESTGRTDRIDQLALEVEAAVPSDIVALRLAQHYHDRDDPLRATQFLTLARTARGADISPMTRDSYAQLQDLLADRGIPFVAVQYANRPVAPLKTMIQWHPDVAFVDNEAVFQEALREHGFDDLFWDHCYGDLGHGTPLGNRILAENVATTVLEVIEGLE